MHLVLFLIIISLFKNISFASPLNSSHRTKTENKIYRIAFENVPSIFNYENGQASGPAVDYLNKIFSAAHVQVEYSEASLSRAKTLLENDQVDILPLVRITKENKKETLNFKIGQTPVYQDFYVLIARKESHLNWNKIKNMKEKNIITRSRTMEMTSLLKALNNTTFTEIYGHNSFERIIQLVLEKKYDIGFISSNFATHAALQKLKLQNQFDVIKIPESDSSAYIVFNKNVSDELIQKIDKQIKLESFRDFCQKQKHTQ